MPEYPTVHIVLMKLTSQGGLEPMPGAVLENAVGALTALGGTVTSVDVTLGEWDYVVRCEGLDDAALLRFAYYVAQRGQLETTTLAGRPGQFLQEIETPDARLTEVFPRRYKIP